MTSVVRYWKPALLFYCDNLEPGFRFWTFIREISWKKKEVVGGLAEIAVLFFTTFTSF